MADIVDQAGDTEEEWPGDVSKRKREVKYMYLLVDKKCCAPEVSTSFLLTGLNVCRVDDEYPYHEG